MQPQPQKLSPDVINHLKDEELENFKELAQSACIRGGGCNIEVALGFLFECNGDLLAAIGKLIAYQPNVWTPNEVQGFERLLTQHGKDFLKISQDLKSKSVKECVEYYYQWKRSNMKWRNSNHNHNNHHHHHHQLVQLNPGGNSNTNTNTNTNNNNNNLDINNNNSNQLQMTTTKSTGSPLGSVTSSSSLATNLSPSLPSASPMPGNLVALGGITLQEIFPCKVCGRTFEKIKSRSAHMKRHKNGR